MAYTDANGVQDPTAGQVLQAAFLDQVRTNQEYFARNRPHCRVYNSSAFSVPNNTATAVTFNSERSDVGGCHSTSVNTARLTVPSGEGGKYLSGGSIEWASHATGVRILGNRVNGATMIVQDRKESATDTTPGQNVSTFYSLAAADYIEMTAFQNSGGALNVSASGNFSPEAWCIWMVL